MGVFPPLFGPFVGGDHRNCRFEDSPNRFCFRNGLLGWSPVSGLLGRAPPGIATFHDQLQPFTTNCNLSRLGQIIKIDCNRKSIKKTPEFNKHMYVFFVATPSRPAILGHFLKLASPCVGKSDFNACCKWNHLKGRSCSLGAA